MSQASDTCCCSAACSSPCSPQFIPPLAVDSALRLDIFMFRKVGEALRLLQYATSHATSAERRGHPGKGDGIWAHLSWLKPNCTEMQQPWHAEH